MTRLHISKGGTPDAAGRVVKSRVHGAATLPSRTWETSTMDGVPVDDLERNAWSMFSFMGRGPGGRVIDTPTDW